MKKPFKTLLVAAVPFLFGFGQISEVQALIAAPEPVTVTEYFDPEIQGGQFTVTNNGDQPIYAFAVVNDAINFATSYSDTWRGTMVSRDYWAEATDFFSLFSTDNGYPTQFHGWTAPETGSVSWDNYFGSDTNKIALYFTGYTFTVDNSYFGLPDSIYVRDKPVNPGDTSAEGFWFFAEIPLSPFVAFGANGNVVATGEAHHVIGQSGPIPAVPEPAILPMLMVGLLVLYAAVTWRGTRKHIA